MRWSPDTCECVIDVAWDTALPEVAMPVAIVKACPDHQGLESRAHFARVLAENRAKNAAVKNEAIARGVPPSDVRWRFTVVNGERVVQVDP
jgi:hypothetical protein